jgi:hypothetical protein
MYAIFTSIMSGGELPGLRYQLCTIKRPAAPDRNLREMMVGVVTQTAPERGEFDRNYRKPDVHGGERGLQVERHNL